MYPTTTAGKISPQTIPPPPPLFDVELFSVERELHLRPGSTVTIPVSIIPHWRMHSRHDGGGLPHDPLRYQRHHSKSVASTTVSGTATTESYSTQLAPDEITVSDVVVASDDNTASRSDVETVLSMSDSKMSIWKARAQMNNSLQVDMNDMILNSPQLPSKHLHQLLSEKSIHETLIANTSWGFLRMKVPYACSPSTKEYEYGLPNNLMFLDGGGGWYARRNTTPTAELAHLFGDDVMAAVDPDDPFVYNVYMNNPSMEKEVHVWEVFTTRPDLVQVEMRRGPSRDDPMVFYPLVGERIIPGKNNVYIATVRLLPQNFNSTMFSQIGDLGTLELRTSVHDFSIALDFIPNRGRWGVVHGISSNHSTIGNIHLARDEFIHSMANAIKVAQTTDPSLSIVKSYRVSAKDQTKQTTQFQEQLLQQQRIENSGLAVKANNKSVMVAVPSTLNFGIITTGSRMIRVPVNLVNTHKRAIRIMRISVSIKMTLEDSNATATDSHKLDIGVDFLGGQMNQISGDSVHGIYEFPHEIVIPPEVSYKFPINVWCRFSASRGQVILPRVYTGAVVLRVTDNVSVTYYDWEPSVILNDADWSSFVTEIPFKGAILPGNFGISTESLLYPTHFSMLSAEERTKIKQRDNGKKPEYFDRELEITNNFAVPISIINMEISDTSEREFCHKHFSIPLFSKRRDNVGQRAEKEGSWRGLAIRFTFLEGEVLGITPKKCILTLETDRVGKQSLPLIVYSGELLAEWEVPEGGLIIASDCVVSTNGTAVSSLGMKCVKKWMHTTVEGRVLHDAIMDRQSKEKSTTKSRACSARSSDDPVESYFLSLLSGPSRPHLLEPIIMQVGAVSAGTIITRSLVLTNLNHAPVEVTATSAAVGGMDVTIGTASSLVSSAMQQLQLDNKADTAYFLANSPLAQDFFSKLKHKVDISLSPRANGSELRSLFGRQAIVESFQSASDFRTSELLRARDDEFECSSGFILSTNGDKEELKSRKAATKSWSIPPGGVARFTITLKVPDSLTLKNDMNSFIATGLVLETSYGQAMPIVLTYSALVGKLQLKTPATNALVDRRTQKNVISPDAIQVPTSITSDRSLFFSKPDGVPLSVESNFTRDLSLGEVKSCNNWFAVAVPLELRAGNNFTIQGRGLSSLNSPTLIQIGEIHSTVSSLRTSSDNSFFSSALAWLESRDKIQPPGCGLSEEEIVATRLNVSGDGSSIEVNVESIKAQTVKALSDAHRILSARFRSTEPATTDSE